MKIAPLFEVKNRLSEYVQQTASGPIVITKNGRPCAALVHLEAGQDMESFLLSHNPRFLSRLDEAAENAQKQGVVPLSAVIEAVRRGTGKGGKRGVSRPPKPAGARPGRRSRRRRP